MKYQVQIMEFTSPDDENHSRETWHLFTGRSLEECWRIAQKHSRRGFNRFGGEIVKSNWGARGGDFPSNYRRAVISAC